MNHRKHQQKHNTLEGGWEEAKEPGISLRVFQPNDSTVSIIIHD